MLGNNKSLKKNINCRILNNQQLSSVLIVLKYLGQRPVDFMAGSDKWLVLLQIRYETLGDTQTALLRSILLNS